MLNLRILILISVPVIAIDCVKPTRRHKVKYLLQENKAENERVNSSRPQTDLSELTLLDNARSIVPQSGEAVSTGSVTRVESRDDLEYDDRFATRLKPSKNRTATISPRPNKIDVQENENPDNANQSREENVDEIGNLGIPVDDETNSSRSLGVKSEHAAPEPYSFSYSSDTHDGSLTTRQETGDKNGRVTGFYMLNYGDGISRRVDYYADETRFHATITTNEVGVTSNNPADVVIRKTELVLLAPPATTRGLIGELRPLNARNDAVSTGSANKIDLSETNFGDFEVKR